MKVFIVSPKYTTQKQVKFQPSHVRCFGKTERKIYFILKTSTLDMFASIRMLCNNVLAFSRTGS